MEEFSTNFALFDFETTLVLLNLAELWMVMGITVLNFSIMFMLKKFCGARPYILGYSMKQLEQVRWNAFIRLFFEFVLDISLFSLINAIRHPFSTKFNGACTIASYALVLFVPALTVFFAVKIERLDFDNE